MPLKELVQDLKDFKRFEQIIHVLFKHGLGYIVEKIKYEYIVKNKRRFQKQNSPLEPKRVRFVLQDLGGTFIKLGQLLSLRPDLIPKEYCDEFSKLQDDVEAFSGIEAKKIMQKEIGIKKRISYFNKESIAAASIGQVHEAVLRNDDKVIIKVQRPEIKKVIETDIDIMYKLARLLEKNFPNNIVKPEDIVREFERYTEDELDYVKEINNCNVIYNNFRKDKNIIIPKPYLDLTTKKVLTLEYIEGKKIENIKSKRFANILATAIFKQIFIDGFFHADPHPGNILIKGDKIAFLDFGIVGKLDEQLKNKITNLFISTIEKDVDSMIEHLLEIGVVENVDINSLKEDIKMNFSEYYKAKLDEINFIEVFEKLINLSKKYNIKLPIDFILLGKSIMTLESVCYKLDPNFDLVETAHPFIKKIIKKETSPEVILNKLSRNFRKFKNFILRIPEEEGNIVNEIKKVDQKISEIDEDLKDLTEEIEKTSNRKVIGYIIASLIIAGAIIFSYNQNLSLYLFIIAFVFFVIFIMSVFKEKLKR